jgi:mRNA degradation ribonuclease J1/J2
MSALTRIAYGDHPNVTVEHGDTVIISAKPVPGNELRVHDAINRLARSGAEVLHQEIAPVHVSGHANSEELRTLLSSCARSPSCRSTGSTGCSPRMRSSRGTRACRPTGSCSRRTAPSSS